MERYQAELGSSGQIDVRKLNIMRSPKRGGSSDVDAESYLKELNIEIMENKQPIQFSPNATEHIHRWAPYVQGFSASFVQGVFNQYRLEYKDPIILDPFAGCGTVLVQAKLNGFRSIGTELNNLLHFMADTKVNCWDITPKYLLKAYNAIPKNKRSPAPSFLKSDTHFDKGVLKNLESIKGGIESLKTTTKKQKKTKDLIRLAFSAILIECSNLKRSPCLGYSRHKKVSATLPSILLRKKIQEIANDLAIIHSRYKHYIDTESRIFLANAINYRHDREFDLVITSPPYMNGMDYVINYKIEMGWLEFAKDHKELKKIKDAMVVCDNVSKGLIREFYKPGSIYTNDWIEKIRTNIERNIKKRGSYRRVDMPFIVHKYFDDLYRVMKNVVRSLNSNGRFILVIGDSLITDVYVPTDLILARIGLDLGLEIERIEKARTRRSGQIRSYKLRESIVTLLKR